MARSKISTHTDLKGIDGSVVSSECIGDLLLRSLCLSVARENHALLCTHHELGRLERHGGNCQIEEG